MIALVFITITPNDHWVKFIQTLKRKNYDIYIAIDDNTYHTSITENIQYINISREECENKGYNHALAPFHINRPSAWDKAIYYFCEKNNNYDYVWFIEDDVFVPTKYTIYNIDKKYKNSDLLCCGNRNNQNNSYVNEDILEENIKDNNKQLNLHWWGWELAEGKIDKPWENSMVCACRLSNKLLGLIKNYVDKHHTLLYHEFMFNTLALHNNLKINYPNQLRGIVWRYDWKITEIYKNGLYHPVKSIEKQFEFRKHFSK